MFNFDFMRAEVWHALSVHFPIALLSLSTLSLLISFFVNNEKRKYWQHTASVLLIVGCITAWISVYTGDLADGEVSRKICDPTILKEHEIAGQTMTYVFTAAAVLQLLLTFQILKSRLQLISSYLIFVLMLVGTGYLVYAGHLGASLVYQQGAGVYKHTVECDEFE